MPKNMRVLYIQVELIYIYIYIFVFFEFGCCFLLCVVDNWCLNGFEI